MDRIYVLYITRKRALLLNFSRYSEQHCRLVEAGYVLGFLLAVDVGRNIDYEHILLPDEVTVFGMGGKRGISMSMTFLDSTTGKLIGNQSRMNSGFDILGLVGLGLSKLFPGKKKSSKREKVRKILDKY